jgi:hypothetical protein
MKKVIPSASPDGAPERVDRPRPSYRFSGHETFPFRYSWLPKAVAELTANVALFSDEERAMVRLGVGKNMVKSIRFWVQAAGIAAPSPKGLVITDFGRELLSESEGHDPYLEDIQTLWLIHWKIASNATEPLFAWEFLLNRWQRSEIVRSEVLLAFMQEASRMEKQLSEVTLAQHFDTFLHTYVPTRSAKGDVREENLDSPLVELDLIRKIGEKRSGDGGRLEAVYAFNREAKISITPGLFIYCINDYWLTRTGAGSEETLSIRDITVKTGSVGQLFKLPESDIRERLLTIEEDSKGLFVYKESAAMSQLIRAGSCNPKLLSSIYEGEPAYA